RKHRPPSSRRDRARRRAVTRTVRVRLERAVPPRARSRTGPRAARRGVAGGVLQERGVLCDVRTEVLLDAHHAGDRAVTRVTRAAAEGEAGGGGGRLGAARKLTRARMREGRPQ